MANDLLQKVQRHLKALDWALHLRSICVHLRMESNGDYFRRITVSIGGPNDCRNGKPSASITSSPDASRLPYCFLIAYVRLPPASGLRSMAKVTCRKLGLREYEGSKATIVVRPPTGNALTCSASAIEPPTPLEERNAPFGNAIENAIGLPRK